MDNDGDMDIVSASGDDDAIAWYENDGAADPSWTAADIATSASGARSVFVADMDGDGDMDIVSASYADNTIAWYENNGAADPSWAAADIATSASGAIAVYIADMDNDGDLDILSASYVDDTIAWYENDGAADPSWTAADIVTNVDEAHSVFAADMDGDGDMDILSASRDDDKIYWHENDGAADPSWTAAVVATSADAPQSVFAADVDNDGDMDILSASRSDDAIAWYDNDGAANPTWTATDIATSADNATSVFVADMDNDGDMDVVSSSSNDDTIAWYENDGAASNSQTARGISAWTEVVAGSSFDNANDVIHADIDGDGDLDMVAVSSGNDDDVSWFINDGSPAGAGWTEVAIDNNVANALSVAVADVDNDGDLDVIASSGTGSDDLLWWINDGSPDGAGWTEVVIEATCDACASVYAVDMDADGDIDVVTVSNDDNDVLWYKNDGSPTGANSFTKYTIDGDFSGAVAVYALSLIHI